MANTQFGGAESVESYRKKIMTILKKNGRTPLSDRELATKCRTNRGGAANFRKAVDELRHEGAICERRRGYVSSANMGYYPATIVRLSRTFGFARPEEEGAMDVFIPGKFLQGAMTKDRVLIGNIPSRSGKPEGEVLAILEEADNRLTGIIVNEDGRLMFRADTMSKTPIQIQRKDSVLYNEGEKVLAEVVYRGQRHAEHKVKIVFSFGTSTRASVCAQAMVALHGVTEEFPEEVVQQADSLANAPIPEEEYKKRLDLRDTPIFTIDSAHSKDLDDAVSLEKTETGYKLGVHIADVSHYVRPKTPLDEEALRRGTSIYYADHVIPMLPKSLSNGICSLNPCEDRLAFSALMELDEKGEIVKYDFRKTVIRSAVKGVYSEVNEILDGSASPELLDKYQDVVHMIPLMDELCDIRLRERKLRGAPELETAEGKLVINEEGVCVDVVARERGKSECIIEEMMLLANEAAAKMAREKNLPFVYRVHDKPNAEKIENLEKILLRLGVEVPVFTDIKPTHLAQILDGARGTDLYPVLNVMVLRSMAKAAYAPEPIGHFGLALKDYAHFTSPIRRYPDLAIHRILSSYCENPDAGAIQERYAAFVVQASAQSSDTEVRAITIERNCDDCYKAEYMQQHLGEIFDGIVAGVTDFGFYVALPNTVEGLVHVASLPESDWINDDSIAFREEQGTACYRLGDTVRVQCTKIDVNSGNVDFALVEEGHESA
ncbi:ribonuclease R [Ruminococcus sp.]|uniref:ribonuclease R n=1 Tax=Ruminococcus sp. TaxID=41978 RepID=UPI0025E96DCD|nr:ribonuclease R [Ruminococcus sp.]